MFTTVQFRIFHFLLCSQKNMKVKVYKSILLHVLLYMCKNWSLTLRDDTDLGHLGIGYHEDHLNPRGKKPHEAGENYITSNFIICTPHKILKQSDQEGWNDRGM